MGWEAQVPRAFGTLSREWEGYLTNGNPENRTWCSMHSRMRRSFSISLVLMFLLAPLASWLPGTDESSLPMCCRRNGGHHCAASLDDAGGSTGAHHFTAPSRCPRYNTTGPATLAAFLPPSSPAAEVPQEQPAFFFTAIQAHQALLRTASDRGPPSLA